MSVFSIFLWIMMRMTEFNSEEHNVLDTYDYIIVGGGSAGAILAGRLAENSNLSVLLIEAGGEGFSLLNIPVLGPLKQLSELDWQYTTVPQKCSCFGLNKNVSKWPSGKILGGSTHLNYMIYLKGDIRDYETWESPESHDWSFADINFYFEKSRKCDEFKSSWDGSTEVRHPLYVTDLSNAVLNAARELGYSVYDDSSKQRTGFMKPDLNLNSVGQRWTSDQYLKKVKDKNKNIHVLTNTVAEEILLLDGFEAHAVKIKRNEITSIIKAKVEVVVSAGTVGSAKLLMLSGIGPRQSLSNANVSVKIDLPVGKNLQDHITTGLDLGILKQHLFSFTDLMKPSSAYEYFVHSQGPFTSGLVDVIGVVHSSLVNPRHEMPDLEFMVLVAGLSSDKGIFFQHAMGISQKVWNEYFRPLINESVVSIMPVLLHPKSSGEIRLNPSNPYGMPDIDPSYLTEETDVDTLVEGIKIVRNIIETNSLRKFGLRFNNNIFPGCGSWKFNSDEYWRCYVRHLTLTVYHPVGTCKMGNLENGGVVDHRLRVYKTNKLRVVDASIMPNLPSANPNAAVLMIAEKAADLIKENFYTRQSTCRVQHVLVPPKTCT
ncbi:hypothetical protein RUM43_002493 [Polyplax serrata]|uniref:Glucose-methanol-choline oxidoreductase N-terminal domain-containing protein n=1 Tax=Polyplax serrata TaxID=468196 RepID=A0AAN8PCT8_POLSC